MDADSAKWRCSGSRISRGVAPDCRVDLGQAGNMHIERALEQHVSNVRNICHHMDAHGGEPDIGEAFSL
jgi:hypothetical protein